MKTLKELWLEVASTQTPDMRRDYEKIAEKPLYRYLFIPLLLPECWAHYFIRKGLIGSIDSLENTITSIGFAVSGQDLDTYVKRLKEAKDMSFE